MVFKCQADPFLKEFTSKVVICDKILAKDEENYEVILEDTILFPEGGGQVRLFHPIQIKHTLLFQIIYY